MKRRDSEDYDEHYMAEALKEEEIKDATQAMKNISLNATSDSDTDSYSDVDTGSDTD
jgi:hypothetical protein